MNGQSTSLTIELCFRPGGTFTGVVPATGDGNFQLVEGDGTYTVGQDVITFGPGNGRRHSSALRMDAGEKYSYLGGSLVPPGQRVYITGRVRFATRFGCAERDSLRICDLRLTIASGHCGMRD